MRVAIAWMNSGSVFADVYLMRVALFPQQELMRWFLHTTGAKWEREQIGRFLMEGQRDFRASMLHSGERFETFMVTTLQQFTSKRLWNHMPETEAWRTRLFKLSWRPAAVVFQLAMLRCSTFPYALFKLLGENVNRLEVAETLLSWPRCLRDSFSKAFLQKYATPESLSNEEAVEILLLLAKKALHTIYSVERLHSRNLRRARARANTHYASVEHLAVSHMGFAAPTWCGPLSTEKEPSQEKDDVCVASSSQRVRRVAGGGAWRAYISAKMSGMKLTSEALKVLARSYQALTREEKAFYVKVGQSGLLARKRPLCQSQPTKKNTREE